MNSGNQMEHELKKNFIHGLIGTSNNGLFDFHRVRRINRNDIGSCSCFYTTRVPNSLGMQSLVESYTFAEDVLGSMRCLELYLVACSTPLTGKHVSVKIVVPGLGFRL